MELSYTGIHYSITFHSVVLVLNTSTVSHSTYKQATITQPSLSLLTQKKDITLSTTTTVTPEFTDCWNNVFSTDNQNTDITFCTDNTHITFSADSHSIDITFSTDNTRVTFSTDNTRTTFSRQLQYWCYTRILYWQYSHHILYRRPHY